MQINILRFGALGPYPGEHVIDFDALGGSALFIIDGPTGAGKSTILDALVFALYADVSGSSSDKQRLRSNFAAATSQSFAEVEFTTAMGRYRVRRTPEFGRPKLRGDGQTTVPATTMIERSTGANSWEPLSTRHGEASLEISRAIGLDKNQFQQTVVLPQGEFATFLRAKSADRQVILERIFATSLYSQIQEKFDEERRAAERDRVVSQGRKRDAAQQLIGRLTAHGASAPSYAAEIEQINSIEDAASTIVSQAVEQLLAVRQQAVTIADAELQAAGALAKKQAALVANLDKAHELEAKATTASVKLAEAIEARASAVELLAEHQNVIDVVAAEVDCDLEIQKVNEAIGALTDLQKRVATMPAQRDEIEQTKRDLFDLRRTIEVLSSERGEVIPTRLQELAAHLRGEQQRVEAEVTAAADFQNQLFEKRLAGFSAELSGHLAAGEPCPVCGSLEHPAPREAAVDQVSEQDLAQARAQLDKKNATRRQLEGQSAKLEVVLTAEQITEGAVTSTASESADADEVDVEVDVDRDLRHLQQRLTGVTEELRQSELQAARLGTLQLEQEQAYQRGLTEIADALGVGADIPARISALKAARAAIEMVRRTSIAVSQAAEINAAAHQAASESIVVVDPEALAEARQLLADCSASEKGLHAVHATLVELADGVEALGAELLAAAVAMDDLDARIGPIIRIADVLNGRGANTMMQPLKAFVVQQMFDEVIAAANIRLSQMLAGRFELVDTEGATGLERLLGLGLEVRDLVTETNRRTETLSGGETFCASLSLALGLADTVKSHAGGIDIGMLFVDEGFGALDQDRLDDVMAELLKLRADGRTVGVISHVSEMKKIIPERITVIPLASGFGSTLEVSWM